MLKSQETSPVWILSCRKTLMQKCAWYLEEIVAQPVVVKVEVWSEVGSSGEVSCVWLIV